MFSLCGSLGPRQGVIYLFHSDLWPWDRLCTGCQTRSRAPSGPSTSQNSLGPSDLRPSVPAHSSKFKIPPSGFIFPYCPTSHRVTFWPQTESARCSCTPPCSCTGCPSVLYQLSAPCCLLGELLVTLQNPTQNHFLLEAFPEHAIPRPTEAPAPASALVLNCAHSSTAGNAVTPPALLAALDHQLLRGKVQAFTLYHLTLA